MTYYIFDCDDVLLNWHDSFAKWLVGSHNMYPDPSGPQTWDLSKWLGVSQDESRKLVSDFNHSPHFARLRGMQGALDTVVRLYGAGNQIHVLTSCGTGLRLVDDRNANLRSVFGDIFNQVGCLPLGASKGDWLDSFTRNRDPKDVVFCEDNFFHARDGARLGIKSYCLRRSHNRHVESEEDACGVIWIDDLSEILPPAARPIATPVRKTLQQLVEELESARRKYHGNRITHVKSGQEYRIVGVHHREHDMAVSVEYTPIGKFYGEVGFARSIEEMDFGNRFVFVGGHVGSLDQGAPNHLNPEARGFEPK